jgi:putative colanic acid biosynthesis UDP-glucose lipid carrier transferase
MNYFVPSSQKGFRRALVKSLKKKYGYFLLKRCVDFTFSLSVILLICPWLMPILMIIIKLDSKGPVFFHQKRTGYLGKTFICSKLRTMRVNTEADTLQAYKGDPRITRFGHFLRKTGLDELPQLFSVLKGDMSLIGPRPHMLKDNDRFRAVVKEYNIRHLVRPGITGISQLKGYRGLTETEESIFRRYQWDVYYLRNSGWLIDAKIFTGTVLLTVKYILGTDNQTPGTEDQKKTGPKRLLWTGEKRVSIDSTRKIEKPVC